MFVCLSVCMVRKVPAGAALRPLPRPLPHLAGVAVRACRDVPGDEAPLRYVPPDPSDALSLLSLLLPGNVVIAEVPIII